MAFGSFEDEILWPPNGWDWISPMHTGNYPLFDDFNKIRATFFERITNCDYTLQYWHSRYIRTVFQGVIFCLH